MTWILPFDLVGAGLRFTKDLTWLFLALSLYRREQEKGKGAWDKIHCY